MKKLLIVGLVFLFVFASSSNSEPKVGKAEKNDVVIIRIKDEKGNIILQQEV